MSIIGSLRVAMRRMDRWINQYTGVGGSKRTAHTVTRTARLAEEVIEELYACDGLAAHIHRRRAGRTRCAAGSSSRPATPR